jgi:hypothetical protein
MPKKNAQRSAASETPRDPVTSPPNERRDEGTVIAEAPRRYGDQACHHWLGRVGTPCTEAQGGDSHQPQPRRAAIERF